MGVNRPGTHESTTGKITGFVIDRETGIKYLFIVYNLDAEVGDYVTFDISKGRTAGNVHREGDNTGP